MWDKLLKQSEKRSGTNEHKQSYTKYAGNGAEEL